MMTMQQMGKAFQPFMRGSGMNYPSPKDCLPAYRIKPLAWKVESDGQIAVCKIGPYWLSAYAWGGWTVQMRGKDGYWENVAEGNDDTLDAAKLAAESAYRKLVAEHLEQVT